MCQFIGRKALNATKENLRPPSSPLPAHPAIHILHYRHHPLYIYPHTPPSVLITPFRPPQTISKGAPKGRTLHKAPSRLLQAATPLSVPATTAIGSCLSYHCAIIPITPCPFPYCAVVEIPRTVHAGNAHESPNSRIDTLYSALLPSCLPKRGSTMPHNLANAPKRPFTVYPTQQYNLILHQRLTHPSYTTLRFADVRCSPRDVPHTTHEHTRNPAPSPNPKHPPANPKPHSLVHTPLATPYHPKTTVSSLQ